MAWFGGNNIVTDTTKHNRVKLEKSRVLLQFTIQTFTGEFCQAQVLWPVYVHIHEGMTCLELEADVQLNPINFIFFHENSSYLLMPLRQRRPLKLTRFKWSSDVAFTKVKRKYRHAVQQEIQRWGPGSVRGVRPHKFGSIHSNVSESPFQDSFKCRRQATVRWWSDVIVRSTG